MKGTPLYPIRWSRNRKLLFYCFELVAFARNEEDTKILAKGGDAGADRGVVKAAAGKIWEAKGKQFGIMAKGATPLMETADLRVLQHGIPLFGCLEIKSVQMDLMQLPRYYVEDISI